jgi:hypothetical protein
MAEQHRATPEQWRQIKEHLTDPVFLVASCIEELRSRIEALENTTNSKPTPNPSQIRSLSSDGLMQAVGAAICSIADCGDTPLNWAPEARAAVLAVAGWLEHRKPAALHCAALLRDEVQHSHQD